MTFAAPEKAGYSFVGWYDAETGGNKVVGIEKGSTGHIELYARWEAKNDTAYTVEHYFQNTDNDQYIL